MKPSELKETVHPQTENSAITWTLQGITGEENSGNKINVRRYWTDLWKWQEKYNIQNMTISLFVWDLTLKIASFQL